MKFHFTQPLFLLLLLPALAWVSWLAWKSDVQASRWRRTASFALRLILVTLLVFALAGLQWLRPVEGMNVFFALDRSESIPFAQQDLARDYVNATFKQKERQDRAGVIVFGNEASIENTPNELLDLQKVQAVVGTERTDIAAAVRLATAAFPEIGQKRLVLLTDGNENAGDAINAVLAARSLGVTVDVVPLGAEGGADLFVQRVLTPPMVKSGQPFEARIFLQADRAREATVRLYRNEQFLGEQVVTVEPGKNLFTFPQRLSEPGFYSFDVSVEAPGDPVPQNNKGWAFTSVQGEPRALIISSEPDLDRPLAAALEASRLRAVLTGVDRFPGSLAELQSYDTIFLCNVAAGELGRDRMNLLESAVRDYGVGLVCVGGDQAFTAGGYRGTPLETALPLNMELDSKKVLPSGAVVLVMHGMEFNNGNAVARLCALGVLDALGPRDEMGVVLWDGSERWLFPLRPVGDKKEARAQIAGMQQGDLSSFDTVLSMAEEALVKSRANLKHIIVFSDGDPAAPTRELLRSIVGNRITVSSVLIAGHFGPETMILMAEEGRGRFYNVTSPDVLPQIFLKETAVILKSAIYEEPFRPQLRINTEPMRGIGAGTFPTLHGYVATMPKPRAEIPLWTDKGDPLLAHWQFGLGRSVAFTSDARARWAREWLGWPQYRQFWSQIAQWSLRRLENANFNSDVTFDSGGAFLNVEALDDTGDYRNFLNLQAVVTSPKGERQTVRLEQTGSGQYSARFDTRETGPYLINVLEIEGGRPRASQVVGASVSYSPEYNSSTPNAHLLRRLAEAGGGRVLQASDLSVNPFSHDRRRTYRPSDAWEWLLKVAAILFVIDVGVRRLQLGMEEWVRLKAIMQRLFLRKAPQPSAADASLAALLARRNAVRDGHAPAPVMPPGIASEPIISKPVALPSAATPSPAPQTKPATVQPDASTTSKLLEAKRRRMGQNKEGK
jgi:uncharacterized membrane protein